MKFQEEYCACMSCSSVSSCQTDWVCASDWVTSDASATDNLDKVRFKSVLVVQSGRATGQTMMCAGKPILKLPRSSSLKLQMTAFFGWHGKILPSISMQFKVRERCSYQPV